MSYKKMSVVWTVLIIGMIAIVFAVTYSYFSGKVKNNGGDMDLSAGEIGLKLTNSEITLSSLQPEVDTAIATSDKVYKKTFTVTRDSKTKGDICYSVGLVVDNLGTSLAEMKNFIRFQVDDGEVNLGGDLVNTEEKTLFENQVLSASDDTKSYNVKVWLSYDPDTDQTSMLESTSEEDRQLKMHLVVKGASCKND